MTLQSVRTIDVNLGQQAHRAARATRAQSRVLCATDLAPRSERAVTRAALLANELDAQLILLHVADPAAHTDGSSARQQIAQQLRSVRPQAPREPTIRVHAGEYLNTIATVAQETDADLIVLGPERRKPLAALIGTTAERLTRLARRPVLIVNREPSARYGAVVIAAELSQAFSRVIRVASLLRFLQAKSVAVVHGFESPYRGPLYAEGFDVHAAGRNIEEWEKAARTRLLQNLDAAGVESSRFRLVFQQSRPIRAIQRVIRSVQPDLLIVGTKERSMLNRLMRGSVANDALRSIECDILVASPEGEAAGVLH